jgi:hypothetical protein
MKTSRTGILLVAAIVAVVAGYLGVTYLRRPQPSFKEAVTLVRSVHAFVEARAQAGSQIPPSIQLRELVAGGYITSEAARRFDGAQVTFPRSPSDPQPLEQAPQQVLISLRLSDGRETVMTADGSIHQSAR